MTAAERREAARDAQPMTAAERREAARLRSERWRRAHGIMPRKPAQKPWLAEGCSRSTCCRRGNRIIAERAARQFQTARENPVAKHGGDRRSEAFQSANSTLKRGSTSRAYIVARLERDRPDLSRASAFVAQLQAELAEVARCQAVTAAIIGEMAAQLSAT